MEIGDIYIVDFPLSNGHEQRGTRPSIIAIDFPELPITQIIPLTTSKKARSYHHTIIFEPDEKNKLDRTSVALLFQLRAVDKRRLMSKIGSLKSEDKERLIQGIREMYSF